MSPGARGRFSDAARGHRTAQGSPTGPSTRSPAGGELSPERRRGPADGAGQRHAQGDRLGPGRGRPGGARGGRGAGRAAVAVRALHRRGVLGGARAPRRRPVRGRAAWPTRIRPAGSGDGHLRGAGQRQGPRPAGGLSEIAEDELRARAGRAGVLRTLGDQQVRRVIVRAPKLVSIVAAYRPSGWCRTGAEAGQSGRTRPPWVGPNASAPPDRRAQTRVLRTADTATTRPRMVASSPRIGV
jgi:hypothetical protein